MEKIRFSVIVPVYNVEKYLKECLESILNQTYKSLEIILVDDGSTDNSGVICDEYEKNYPETISVIHKKNQGLISARRRGLKQALGEYICFVDSDDYIREDTLEKINKIIMDYQVDMIIYDCKRVSEKGEILCSTINMTLKEGIVEKKELFKRVIEIEKNTLNSLCLKVCKYNMFDVEQDYSHLYDIQRQEDLIQSIPLFKKVQNIYYLKEQLYYYRVNLESISHQYQKPQYRALNVTLPLLYDCIVELGYNSKENVLLFYRNYLQSLWDHLLIFSRSNAKLKEYRMVFTEIISYRQIKNAKSYVKIVRLYRHDIAGKIGLKLFYAQYWNILICYLKFLSKTADFKNKRNRKVWRK